MCCLHRICGIHHLQRVAAEPWGFGDCVWNVVVSFGDVRPDNSLAQVYFVVIVVVAIFLLPFKVCLSDQHQV